MSPSRAAAVGGLLAAVVAWATVTGCDSLPGRPREADRPLRPSEVTDFARLWGENCSGCHGAEGRLGAATPLGTPSYLAAASDASIRTATAAGIRGTSMPAFAVARGGGLTERQVDLLVEGLRARWGAPVSPAPPPIDEAAAGDPARGAAVFESRCAGCHGPGGTGGPKGGSVVDPDYLRLASDRALRAATIAGRPDLGMPDWRGGSGDRPLEAGEVADVVAWMASHRPTPPAARAPAAGPAATITAPGVAPGAPNFDEERR